MLKPRVFESLANASVTSNAKDVCGQTRCRHRPFRTPTHRSAASWSSARTRSSLPAPGTGHRRACDRPRPRHAARSTCVAPPASRPSRAWAFAAAGVAAAPAPTPRRFPARRDRRRSRARAPRLHPSAAQFRHAQRPAASAATAMTATPPLKDRRVNFMAVSFMRVRISRRTARPARPPPASPRRTGRKGSCTAHR